MALIVLLLVTALVWVGLRGQLGPSTVVVLGAVAVCLLARYRGRVLRFGSLRSVVDKSVAVGHIVGLFAVELLLSNIQQLRIVFGPARMVSPHWLHFRSSLRHPSSRALFGVLISLTPGTLTCEFDSDGTVWVHALVAEDDEAAIARLRRLLEAPLRRLES